MRIIGGHDYYDTAVAYGRDESVVFVRLKQPREIQPKDCPITIPYIETPAVRFRNFGRMYYDPNIFIVAGKMFPAVRLLFEGRRAGSYSELTDKYCYSINDIETFIAECGGELVNEARWRGRSRYTSRWRDEVVKLSKYFDRTITDNERDWLIKERITVMRSQELNLRRQSSDDFYWIVDSDDLSRFDMPRVLDPYQAHQEIAMWVGGVLPSNGNPMVEIADDKVKAHKAGFDKWSFRKMPEATK